jgi:hypothetical protein
MICGCKKLLWHKLAISHKDLQVLPAGKRRFPFAPPQNTSNALYKVGSFAATDAQRLYAPPSHLDTTCIQHQVTRYASSGAIDTIYNRAMSW